MFPFKKKPSRAFVQELEELMSLHPEQQLHLKDKGTDYLPSWFLGPKAENQELFTQLITQAVEVHSKERKELFPDDPIYITEEMKESAPYKESVDVLKQQYTALLEKLEGSVPFYSYRYQGHMNWDLTMPGVLGYFAAMLYNPNNVASEASPVTTVLEMKVGDDLCEMLGYTIPTDEEAQEGAIRPWGHITCDGSVANLEAMWAARNLRYYGLTIAEALKKEPSLASAKEMTIPLVTGGEGVITELDTWSLLNLKLDDVLDVPNRMVEEYGIEMNTVTTALTPYTLQAMGIDRFNQTFFQDEKYEPALLVTATMHYSWPKAAAVLGLGSSSIEPIPVDLNARMDINQLRSKLEECLEQKRPVMLTVAVIGSTEESAVDPLSEVIQLREEFRKKGLEFPIHADAAWGGYFASILRQDPHVDTNAVGAERQYTPEMTMSEYVNRQYEALKDADSITIDPHKGGYIPYPAGGLCYRNSAMRNLVAFTAPVVYHGGIDPTVGVYGIEGSKPGAAAAGVYLSHRIVRTNQSGYGKILGKTLFNSKRLYSAVITMASEDDPFIIVPFQQIPAEKEGKSPEEIQAQLEYIKTNIADKTNDEIISNPETMKLFRELGSDQTIIAYAFNFKTDKGINQDVSLANELNMALFERLSLSPDKDKVQETPMFLTSSEFDPESYGEAFVDSFKKRLGVTEGTPDGVTFLLSTTMNPFLTDTSEGSFIPTLMEALRAEVIQAVDELKAKHSL